jgi:anti-sigma factor RsiW
MLSEVCFMNNQDEKIIGCSEFEENLTDYLDGTLERRTRKAVAEHALACPLCHSLLNEVKAAVEACHEISVPKVSITHLEARILAMTAPETAMSCTNFEDYLTDYLDGFLAASIFHRWERHAVLCENCTDLPGEVVRSIAACYSYKAEELPLPEGFHERVLQATIGTTKAKEMKASWASQGMEWLRGLSFPVQMPQLAPVAMILLIAFLFFNQTVSADGSISGIYQKSFELAGQTYKQGTEIMLGGEKTETPQKTKQEPVEGTFVNQGESK